MGRVYDQASWRALPRTGCVIELLLGDAADICGGLLHRHHVDPSDPESRTVTVCARHHPQLHGILNQLEQQDHRRRCPHRHATREGREQCERRLNSRAA